ncbi:substrate-binding periplasmic protein [Pseudoalteromonas rubra]|uniref:substrate-binding periplasmic protein n=1 Tax=Pseudoalteromonas rubra TaxID=43658 RepID=UPI0005FA7911|nr:transporter substrate-binding domain-containing protein [Pseudoalteromonas rubra]
MTVWRALLLGLVVICLLGASAPEQRVIRLVTLEYPPYEFQGKNGPSGIAVELVREVFRRMEQPYSIDILPWGRAIREVETGRYDGIFTIYKTPQRLAFLDYSDEMLIEQSIALFTLRKNNIHFDGRLNSLAPYRVGVMHKVSYGKEIDMALKRGVFENVVTTDTGRRSFELLLADRVEVVVINRLGALEIIKQLGIEDLVAEVPSYRYEIPSYIAFSKVRALDKTRLEVEQALREIKKDGTYDKILQEYLKHYNKEQSIYDTSPQTGKAVEERS